MKKKKSPKRLFGSLLAVGAAALFLCGGLLFLEWRDTGLQETVPAGGKEGSNAISKAYPVPEQTAEKAKKEPAEDEKALGQEVETEEKEEEEERIEQPASLLFTGDVLLSSHVLSNYEKEGIDGILSKDLQKEFQAADLVMVNEEFPFSERGTKAEDKQYTFRVSPSYASVFKELGVTIAGLANNHVLDFGKEALADTFAALDGAGIMYAGAGETKERAKQLITAEAGGKTFGFLAASRVIPVADWNVDNGVPGVFTTYDPAQLVEEIKAAQSACDFLSVFVHWGIERDAYPQEYQTKLAHAYIDAGADLVVGAHPHVLQGVELYNGKPVFYSLGNFIFNQSIEKTAALKVAFENGEPDFSLIPARASGAKTQKLEGEERTAVFRYVESISKGIRIEENGTVILDR